MRRRSLLQQGELLSVVFAIAMLLCIGVFSSLDWLGVRQNRAEYFAARNVVEHAAALLNAVTDAESIERGYVLTGDNTFLVSWPQAAASIARELTLLENAVRGKSARDQVAVLRAVASAKLDEMSQTIELRRHGGPGKALALVETDKGRLLMDDIRRLTARIRAEEVAVSDARSARGSHHSDRAYLVSILSSAILFVILCFGVRNIDRAASRREKLIAGLAEFAATLDKTHVIVQDLDGTILSWNSGAETLYGWSRSQALGRNSHELLDVSLPQPLDTIRETLLKTGSWTGEFRQRRRDGSEIWVMGHWTLIQNSAGQPVSVIKLNNDITALKNSENALRASEATARSFFENAAPGILTADRDGRIVDANAMAVGMFGYCRDELIGSPVEMLLPEALRERHVAHRAGYALRPRARPMGQGIDLVARRKDGSELPVEISLSFVEEHRGGGLVIAYISDISARKQSEAEREHLIARLESALSEKTVLLKEVHHRVKNNLAVIAGLLGMQSEAMGDAHSAEALEESQQRVASMALIHEYLYSTEHLDRVNFGKYVEQLARELFVSYALEPELVSVIVDAEEIDLGVHRAIPCGLILNELFSNALKYAFPRGRIGTITVHFGRLESGDLTLSCADDGVGIPPGFDWEKSQTVGLRVVRILARQIDGSLTVDGAAPGARFELRFPPFAGTAGPPPDKVEAWSAPDARGPSHSLSRSASG